jgi:hypothetical protein
VRIEKFAIQIIIEANQAEPGEGVSAQYSFI